MNSNIFEYQYEYKAVGLTIVGVQKNGDIIWSENTDLTLLPLVLAAHEQPLTSTECLALQAAITNDQWLAYIAARQAPIKQARAERYKNETDALLLSAFETALKTATATNGEITVVLSETATQEWLTAKETVRIENPYETED